MNAFRVVITALILALVSGGMVVSLQLIDEHWDSVVTARNSRAEVRSLLINSFCLREVFISLNGGVLRLLGQLRCNGVYRIPNGHLIRSFPRADQKWRAERIKRLADQTEKNGSKFLFVLFPNKVVAGGKMFPGDWSPGNAGLYENADELLGLLTANGVETLDLRPIVSPDEESVMRHFFKTDHHWNVFGAFEAFRYLAPEFELRATGVSTVKSHPNLQLDNWERRPLNRKHNRFLGSNGRRTGPLFGGFDSDYVYLVPKFSIELEHRFRSRGSHKQSVKRGDFVYTSTRLECVAEPKSLLSDMAYSVYYTDLAESNRFNASAPCKARLLIVKDSYALPLLPMLSTVFSEVTALDLRYNPSKGIAETICAVKPDLVVLAYNPSSFLSKDNALWNF